MAPQIESDEDERKVMDVVLVYDSRFWLDMLDEFKKHSTPLGRALRLHSHQRQVLSESRLLQTVTRRRLKVIGHLQLVEGGHTAFLGVAGGRLIRVSDHNAPVPERRRNTGFAADVFTPR
jgi:hypothetical protein